MIETIMTLAGKQNTQTLFNSLVPGYDDTHCLSRSAHPTIIPFKESFYSFSLAGMLGLRIQLKIRLNFRVDRTSRQV